MWRAVNRRAAALRGDRSRRLAGRGLALVIVVLGSLDVVSTHAAIAAGHVEGNPVMSLAQERLGDWWVAPKLLGHLVLALPLLWLPSRRLLVGAAVVALVYLGIVAKNFALAGWAI